jgi:hypothetical protein
MCQVLVEAAMGVAAAVRMAVAVAVDGREDLVGVDSAAVDSAAVDSAAVDMAVAVDGREDSVVAEAVMAEAEADMAEVVVVK